MSLKTQQSVERTLVVEPDKFDLASGSNQVICNQLLHVPNLGENPQVMGVHMRAALCVLATASCCRTHLDTAPCDLQLLHLFVNKIALLLMLLFKSLARLSIHEHRADRLVHICPQT